MGDTTDIKKGAVIKHANDLYVVIDFKFVNPGKGSAFSKTKMKGIASGKNIEITYKSGESVDIVQVERQNMQYLYENGGKYSFMHKDTYEIIEIEKDVIGDDTKYLREGLEVIVSLYQGNPVSVQLPRKVSYKVVDSPPAVKGDTASGNVTKEIGLDNGLSLHAPIFIKEGDVIIVNTDTGEYGGREV